ncbi:hypothetical protein [Haloactinopolyspora sp.]|uniref:hypothetical protein n=1 Tax=Haloactinopolyspora sp. TaxID=1966353 RepID=UPI0026361111|nr:hypothetical protein [Haloactinopolyspora sp.]
MGWFSRRGAGPEPQRDDAPSVEPAPAERHPFANLAVPELASPEFVIVNPVDDHSVLGQVERDWQVEVHRPGQRSYDARIAMKVPADSPFELSLDMPLPGLIDADAPDRVYLLEAPGGDDVPRPSDQLKQYRVERDLRTVELLERYPRPTVEDLAVALANAPVPPKHLITDAFLTRLDLLTTFEARRIADRARAMGETWTEIERDVSRAAIRYESSDDERFTTPAYQLATIAPGGEEWYDEHSFIFMVAAQAVYVRESDPSELPAIGTILRPFVEEFGAIPLPG